MEETKEKKVSKAEWKRMTLAEKRKLMPEKMNKFGEWFFSEEGERGRIKVNDMRAVLK